MRKCSPEPEVALERTPIGVVQNTNSQSVTRN